MNLKINILTKERNANFELFLCFTKNFRKLEKTVLTIVAEKAADIFRSLNIYIIFYTTDSI